MKPIENNPVSPPQVASSGFTTQIVQWLGRVWSTCVRQLKAVIKRIKSCACPHLDEPKQLQKPKKKDELDILSEFPSLKLPPVSPPVRSVPLEPKPIKLEPLTDILYKEADFSLEGLFEGPTRQIEQKPANSTPLIQEIETQKEKAIDQLSAAKEEKKQEEPAIPTFKRRYAKVSSEKDQTDQKLTSIHSVLGKSVSSIEGFKVIEVKADGNCLLLSILKGLELQYPALMKYKKEGDPADYEYTGQDIRNLGIEFVKNQIDKCDTFVQEVLGYLDTDRKEHNEAVENHVNFSLKHELAKLTAALKEKKIKSKEYTQQVQEMKGKHQQLKEKLRIQTDEEFLNCLAKNGFFCSTLHLFALSTHFQIPIHVHEQAGVARHNIQIFNPTQSAQEPIHLYRINNNHYQFLLKELPKAAEA